MSGAVPLFPLCTFMAWTGTSLPVPYCFVYSYRRRCRRRGMVSTNHRGPAPDYVAYVFNFVGSIPICRLYKLALSDQAQVALQLRTSLSDLVSPPLLGSPKFFFHGGPNPLSAALAVGPSFFFRTLSSLPRSLLPLRLDIKFHAHRI
jgi:hypothetical protein